MHHDTNDKGRRVAFQRGSVREERMIETVSNFLILHEAVRDREGKEGA